MESTDARSLKKYENKAREAERKADFVEEAYYSTLIADLQTKYDYNEAALEHYQRALSLYEGLKKDLETAVACRLLGECYCKLGELDKALQLHQRYLQLASACKDGVEEQRALTTIGNTYRCRHQVAQTHSSKMAELEKAESSFTKSLQLCDELKSQSKVSEKDYRDMKGRLLYNLGLVYIDLGNKDASIQQCTKALPCLQGAGCLDVLFDCQKLLAELYTATGKLTEAKRLLHDAWKTARRSQDKDLEAEAMLAKALVEVQLKEFQHGRHLLKKVHHMKSSVPGNVIKIYTAVKKYERLREKLKQSPADDMAGLSKLYEKLADTAVDMELPRVALIYYNKQLAYSERAGMTGQDLVGIHVSLAQTYEDIKEYNKAVQHYQREIECRGDNHEQISRSWLNIASNQENAGVKYSQIQQSYVNAFNSAKNASHRLLQARSLTALAELCKLHKNENSLKKTLERLNQLKNKYNITDSQLEQESQQTDDDDGGDVVAADNDDVMSELTESEEEEEKEVFVRAVRKNGRKTLLFERNKLGETPLHRACIKGQLAEVKALVSQGHQLNPQDYNGWTPLHEATNNGHYIVTEYLVTHGADINNRGGAGCKGTTPLIDAATNGHIEIMELLIRHGANVVAKDDHGKTALYYFEKLYKESDDIDRDLKYKCENMIALLKEKMPDSRGVSRRSESMASKSTRALIPTDTPGHTNKSQTNTSTQPSISSSTNRNTSRSCRQGGADRWGLCALDSDTDDDDTSHSGSDKNSRRSVDQESHHDRLTGAELPVGNATDLYRHAVSGVGRSARQSSQYLRKEDNSSTHEQPALVNEEDFLGEDDWLEDDLKKPTSKRKNVDCHGLLSSDRVRKRNRSLSLSPKGKENVADALQRRSSQSNSQKKKRLKVKSDSESESSDDETGAVMKSCQNLDLANDSDNNVNDDFNAIDICFDDIDDDFDDDVICSSLGNDNFNNISSSDRERTGSHTSQIMRKGSPKQTKITNFGDVNECNSVSESENSDFGDCLDFGQSRSPQNNASNRMTPTNRNLPTNNTANFQNPNASNLPARIPPVTMIPQTTAIPPARMIPATIPPVNSAIRLTVKVDQASFIIPVVDPTGTKTIAWLAEEAESRYHQLTGLSIKVSLTKDGACLLPSDPVTLLLQDNDKIEAISNNAVAEKKPVGETYRNSCHKHKQACYKNIEQQLESSSKSGHLHLTDCSLHTVHWQPVLDTFAFLNNLTHLQLQGNRLGDVGMKGLCGSLMEMTGLIHLDLASNDISAHGVQTLATTLRTNNNFLQKLESLDLSYNTLEDDSGPWLVAVVGSLPALCRLYVKCCQLTKALFHHDRPAWIDTLQGSHIEQLDISYNTLGGEGLEFLLRCLNCCRVTSLDLSATLSESDVNTYQHLYSFTSQTGCSLRELTISNCHLTMDNVDSLYRLPTASRNLQKLDLSCNPGLDIQVLPPLLTASMVHRPHVEEINLLHCGFVGPLTTQLLDTLVEKQNCLVPLRKLKFTCTQLEKADIESLKQIWKTGANAKVDIKGDKVLLTLL